MFLICTNFNLKFRIKGITCEPSVFQNETHDNFGQSFRPKSLQTFRDFNSPFIHSSGNFLGIKITYQRPKRTGLQTYKDNSTGM